MWRLVNAPKRASPGALVVIQEVLKLVISDQTGKEHCPKEGFDLRTVKGQRTCRHINRIAALGQAQCEWRRKAHWGVMFRS